MARCGNRAYVPRFTDPFCMAGKPHGTLSPTRFARFFILWGFMALSDLTVAEVDTAIRSILLNGVYIASNGDILRKASLTALRALRKDAIANETSQTGSFFNRQKQIRPHRG